MAQLIPTRALTPQIGLGLLGWPSRGYLRSGGARLGRSQKDGLLSAAREKRSVTCTAQGHRLALEGAAWSLPLS
jgi:hypothetical protein